MVVSFYLFKEAFVRFIHPVNVNTGVMITVALIGLIANAVSVDERQLLFPLTTIIITGVLS